MYGYIYKTTNLTNNKIYIGQKKATKFLGNSYLGNGKRLKEAFLKYDRKQFFVELLDTAESADELDEKEIYWIKEFNSTDPSVGYNLSIGGNTPRGLQAWNKGLVGVKKHSLETRRKMSESRMGHPTSDETKRKLRESNIGKKRTPEQNEANRQRNINKVWIRKDGVETTVQKEVLQKYLDDGWERGRTKYNAKSWNKGQTKYDNPIIAKYAKQRKERLDSGERIGFCQKKIK